MDPFLIRRIDGKGFGMVAVRDIEAGDLVIEESALVTTRLSEDGDLLGKFQPNTDEFICNDLIRCRFLKLRRASIC
jgi:hypothetical protein